MNKDHTDRSQAWRSASMHNLVLTPGQMEDIIHAARQVPASEVPVIPVHPAVEPEKPGYDWRNYQMPPQ